MGRAVGIAECRLGSRITAKHCASDGEHSRRPQEPLAPTNRLNLIRGDERRRPREINNQSTDKDQRVNVN